MEMERAGQGVVVVAEVTEAGVMPQCKVGSVRHVNLTGHYATCNPLSCPPIGGAPLAWSTTRRYTLA